MNSRTLLALVPLVGLAFLAAAPSGDDAKKPAAPAAAEVAVPFFGNAVCPVSNKPAAHDKYAEKDGERIYTCCGKCEKAVEADFDKFKATAYPADKVVDIANATCPIGHKKAKDSVTTDWQGHRVRFCCADCKSEFLKAPNKNLELALHPDLKLAENAKCPVSGEDDADGDTFVVYRNVLVNLCCADCADKFKADPEKYAKAAGVDFSKEEAGKKDAKKDGEKQGG